MWKFYLKKIVNPEYWPFYILYFPLIPLYLFYSLKNKSLIYFTAANPGIHYGGLFNYSKSQLNQQILLPFQLKQLSLEAIKMPFIAKPDKGERGKDVFIIESEKDFNKISQIKGDVFYQEYDASPLEFGVFYAKMPQRKGKVISITSKEFLCFNGDGKTSLKEYLLKNEKAFYARKRLLKNYADKLNLTLQPGEYLILEKIGNHHRGTTFLDGNSYYSKDLEKKIQSIAEAIEGFNYGRFDLKANSVEQFRQGIFKVIEVNGVNSEPTHIYDPKYTVLKMYKEIYKHLKIQEKISSFNLKNGFTLPPFKRFVKDLAQFLIFNK